jgi:succinoglycan biosynthesis protein ExoA
MRVSIILTAIRAEACSEALSALSQLNSPTVSYEILLALGRNPSLQRNEAAREATGDFLLFLDDDSVAHTYLLRYYEDGLTYEPDIGVVGGPALYRFGDTLVQRAIAEVLSSPFGLGPFRSRYSAEGLPRRSSERELILCNMLVSRKLFLDEKGFHTELYPNEENEFLKRVQARTKIYFHPLAVVFRSAPGGIRPFAAKMFNYGVGRAKHMRLFPSAYERIFLLPAVFCLFALALPLLYSAAAPWRWLLFLPWLAYFSAELFASLPPALVQRRLGLMLVMPLLFFTCHFAYGVGLLWGLVRFSLPMKVAPANVTVQRLREFG